MNFSIYSIGLILLGISQFSCGGEPAKFYEVASFPETLQKNCREGNAKLYDECGSQMLIAKKAFELANSEGKTPLIVFGAEWCIWCHVFDKHVKGGYEEFSYKWEYQGKTQRWRMFELANKAAKAQAKKLNKYVADNFVVVHIESDFAPDGNDVITSIGFDRDNIYFYPYILVVNDQGEYAGHMEAYDAIEGLELREDSGNAYRGFDREILLTELMRLRAGAQ